MRRPGFRLAVDSLPVERVVLGEQHGYADRTVTVDPARMRTLALSDDRIAGLEVSVAAPGDNIRVVNCLDAIEPRCKVDGPGPMFPGFLGPPVTVGRGTTLRLAGMALLTTAEFSQPQSGLLTARDAVVDMSGPGVDHSPFSRITNLVLGFVPTAGIDNAEADDAIRRAALAVAEDLARACADGSDGADRLVVDLGAQNAHLPSIAYFYQIQSQGAMADTFLYGRPTENLVATMIHPCEVIDGAIVSGVYVYAAVKNPTYFHQNNPVMWELMGRDGVDLNFAGIILNRGHNYTQEEKERSSQYGAKIARLMGVDGVVLTTEGGGNSLIDTMLACQYLEQEGIKTVLLNYEQPGPEGREDPLFYGVPEADAIVSLGMFGPTLSLPAVPRVLGGNTLRDGTTLAGESLELPGLAMFCATSQVGGNTLVGKAF